MLVHVELGLRDGKLGGGGVMKRYREAKGSQMNAENEVTWKQVMPF